MLGEDRLAESAWGLSPLPVVVVVAQDVREHVQIQGQQAGQGKRSAKEF